MGGLCAELDTMATYILQCYMAVWRNGIASDYDSDANQEIAGSTPVSVIFIFFELSLSETPTQLSFNIDFHRIWICAVPTPIFNSF